MIDASGVNPVDPPTRSLPVLPLRDSSLFPTQLQTVVVGRPASQAAVEMALGREEKLVLIVAQRGDGSEWPREMEDLYPTGSTAIVKKVLRLDNGSLQIVAQGVERVEIVELETRDRYLEAIVRPSIMVDEQSERIEALSQEVQDEMRRLLTLTKTTLPEEVGSYLTPDVDPMSMFYFFSTILSLEVEKEQSLLESPTLFDGLVTLYRTLAHEVRVFRLRDEIASQARQEMNRDHREYLLRQQMRAIRKELGETRGANRGGTEELRERVNTSTLTEDARREAERELDRLDRLPSSSPDSGTIREHLEFLLELPWETNETPRIDVAEARRVLDEDHYGLAEVKERVLEHLGVLRLNPGARAPILCFVGPPGVGKTSLGEAIARAMSREFERMSLGGLHDESELRGHRRTYVGAMPGRVLQAIRRVGVSDPVLMLDEIDKLGRDARGDPAAALLEVLDSEQNREFRDNYLGVPFDLSKVFFVATANSLENVPAPLLDRMEVVRFSGYSDEEKAEIARRYLLPRQLSEAGVSSKRCTVTSSAIARTISCYMREAGVRQLHRRIGKIARKAALQIAEDASVKVAVDVDDLDELLGPERFPRNRSRVDLTLGVAQGLAWTPVGGEMLYIETSLLAEGEGLTMTGQLGDVMRESALTAHSFVWAHAAVLGIDPRSFRDAGMHVHVPQGAIPKDGPSAGITLAAAIVSLLRGQTLRKDTVMTGEITLTGLVLPVGGIKEKVLAARRAGIRRVVLPEDNRRDARDLPDEVLDDIELVFVEAMSEVLGEVLEESLTPHRGQFRAAS
jgi:ATP-dependent Lon protease